MYYAYILQSQRTGRHYIGSTGDIAQRVVQHNSGMSKSTRPFRPWDLIYTEWFETRSEAVRRENQIKSWKSHAAVDALIDSKLLPSELTASVTRRDTIFHGPGL